MRDTNVCTEPPIFLKSECFQGRVIEKLSFSHIFSALEWFSAQTNALGSGGIGTFIGIVKGIVDGVKVKKLIYSSYEPQASNELDAIAKSYAKDEKIYGVIILHTTGEALPGSPTLLVAVSGRNRENSIRSLEKIVEEVKRRPPIFKLEIREDGQFWVLGEGTRIPRKRYQSGEL